MRIALLAPLVSPIAPPFLGGAQALLADLAGGLAARGHTVTLYAAAGSAVPSVRIVELDVARYDLQPVRFEAESQTAEQPADRADAEDDEADLFTPDAATYFASYAFLDAFRLIARHADEHDLLHAHAYDWPAFSYATLQPLPIVHTLHLPSGDPAILRALATLAPPDQPRSRTRLVTVSHACAATYAPHCRIDAVIYNGVPVARIPLATRTATDPCLLFAGRMSPEKGVEDAIAIAARAGLRLLLAGGVYDPDYFAERIAPKLSAAAPSVEYVGALSREALWRLMGGARAVLCPVRWDEPFGLVACEAQAAGTPVVGYGRGGLREVVADGVTGYLVPPGDIDGATKAVARAVTLDRAACRAHIARRFSLETMLDGYERFYAEMLSLT
jgi:UDP-glucose:tetrahydrobiopterin glucosyltransferase